MFTARIWFKCFSLVALSLCWTSNDAFSGGAETNAPRWWKGNTHTHSLWSDGDDFPEMIIDWYKKQGYDFLALSDHNSIGEGDKSVAITSDNRTLALKKYLKRFGPDWVDQRVENGTNFVRLKPFNEFRPLFDEANKFLLIRAEEISAHYLASPVHIGAVNVRDLIEPKSGSNIVQVMQNNLDAVYQQRKETGQAMFPHINHPNFQWALTAEEMMQVKSEKFFEVYNGHTHVRNEGDALHANTERIWDIILTRRLAELNLDVVYGIATDDSHSYHYFNPRNTNPGRGWIMVRAARLTPATLIQAMEAGDFYASSGVQLKEVRRGVEDYFVKVEPQRGATFTIQFIGTRKGFDAKSEPVQATDGALLRVTHHYSSDIGQVLAEVKGTSATYKLKGDEIYVRAKIISSKPRPEFVMANKKKKSKTSAGAAEEPVRVEYQTAWTQPLVTGVK